MSPRICQACGFRPAAHTTTLCLACSAAGAPGQVELVNESDPRAISRLASTLHGNPRACERCEGPVRCINTFGGAGFYRCSVCGHESETTRETVRRL